MDVPADGSRAVLGARSMLGLFRGLNTFAQLCVSHDCGGDTLDRDGEGGVVMYRLSAPVAINIKDSPAYVSLSVSWGSVRC